ncbi:hypothetical protein HDU82_005567 [Entophlyctis luteolus]|nr:hypothetical protein HDU82_005567 [Entophlyctis luteolus]
MVLLRTTSAIDAAAEYAGNLFETIPAPSPEVIQLKAELEEWRNSVLPEASFPELIPHPLVARMSGFLTANRPDSPDAEGSQMVFPSPKPPEKSAKLQQLLADAKILVENKEYSRMTKDVVPNQAMGQIAYQERYELKTTIGMLSAVLNVILSMVAVFVAVFWIGDTVVADVGLKTLLALTFAAIVGVAEGWFFSRDWLFEDGARSPAHTRRIVGRNGSFAADAGLFVDAGSDIEASLDASLLIKLTSSLKACRITVELIGSCYSRWEFGGKLATKPETERDVRNTKVFQHLTEVLHDAKEPLQPSPVGAVFCLAVVVRKQTKCSLEWSVPLTVSMPDSAKVRLLHSSSFEHVEAPVTSEKVGYSIDIPQSTVAAGDTIEVIVALTGTPANTRLRMLNASLRTLVSYINADKVASYAKFPRPLSETTQSFPLIKIGGLDSFEPLVRKFFLLVDPDLAKISEESPLISVKTVFRLAVTIDNSESANVVVDVPITVVPPFKDPQFMATRSPRDPAILSANGLIHQFRSNSISSQLSSPTLMPQVSLPNSRQVSVHSSVEQRYSAHRNHSLPMAKEFYLPASMQEVDAAAFAANQRMVRKSSLQSPSIAQFAEADAAVPEIPGEHWSVEMVADWVRQLGASEEDAQAFLDSGVDGCVLLGLTAGDLKDELRIQSFGLRRRILQGWDVDSILEAAAVIVIDRNVDRLKNVRVQCEFRGYTETRWESGSISKLAVKYESPNYRVSKTAKQLVEVVYDSRHPLVPSRPGAEISLPFRLKLPKSKMPPSFACVHGVIEYYIKCTMLFQEGIRMLRSTLEVEVPVIVNIPEQARLRILQTPSQVTHESMLLPDKVHFTVSIPKVIVTVGDFVDVTLTIHRTPPQGRLRAIFGTLRPVMSFLNSENVAAQAIVRRPMAEWSNMFPLVAVNETTGPLTCKMRLEVDPETAHMSFESILINVRTIFRLQITTDDSEVPNISEVFSIVVMPRSSDHEASRDVYNITQQTEANFGSPEFMSFNSRVLSRHSPGFFSPLPDPSVPLAVSPGSGGFQRNSLTLVDGGNLIDTNGLKKRKIQSHQAQGQHQRFSHHRRIKNHTRRWRVQRYQESPIYLGYCAIRESGILRVVLLPLTQVCQREYKIYPRGLCKQRLIGRDSWEPLRNLSKHLNASVDFVRLFVARVDFALAFLIVDHQIDGGILLTLTEGELKGDLKVSQLGVRRKMTNAIEKFKGTSVKSTAVSSRSVSHELSSPVRLSLPPIVVEPPTHLAVTFDPAIVIGSSLQLHFKVKARANKPPRRWHRSLLPAYEWNWIRSGENDLSSGLKLSFGWHDVEPNGFRHCKPDNIADNVAMFSARCIDFKSDYKSAGIGDWLYYNFKVLGKLQQRSTTRSFLPEFFTLQTNSLAKKYVFVEEHVRLLKRGFAPWPFANDDENTASSWPPSAPNAVGSVAHNLQTFGSPYIHGGFDIRTYNNASCHSPVDGKVVRIVQYNEKPADLYFSVMIQDEFDFIWQFHHLNPSTFTVKEGDFVKRGHVIGRVTYWPDTMNEEHYHHIHLNVVRAKDSWNTPKNGYPNPYTPGWTYYNPFPFFEKGKKYNNKNSPTSEGILYIFDSPNSSAIAELAAVGMNYSREHEYQGFTLNGTIHAITNLGVQFSPANKLKGYPYSQCMHEVMWFLTPRKSNIAIGPISVWHGENSSVAIGTPYGGAKDGIVAVIGGKHWDVVGSLKTVVRFDQLPPAQWPRKAESHDQDVLLRLYATEFVGRNGTKITSRFEYDTRRAYVFLTNTDRMGQVGVESEGWDSRGVPNGEYFLHVVGRDWYGQTGHFAYAVDISNS